MTASYSPLRLGSLCSGYEGLGMAVADVLDIELAWVADPDPGASAVLAYHWPHVPNLGDITVTDWAQVAPVDIITAGFPCQDVSCAGRREGIKASNRSGVWAHVALAIEALRPSLVFIENVGGLLSAAADSDVEPCPWCLGDAGDESHLRALGAVLGDLASLGFDAEWESVQADEVGAAHRRRRVFIGARPTDAEGQRFQRDGLRGWSACGGVATADTDGVRGERNGPGGLTPQRHAARADRVAADATGIGEREPADPPHSLAGGGEARTEPRSGGLLSFADSQGERHRDGRPPRLGGVQAAPVAGSPTDAESDGRDERRPEPARQQGRLDAPVSGRVDWGTYRPAVARWERVLGRPAPDPTGLTAKGGTGLSPTFVEWLMGLPAGHVTDVPGLTRNQQLRLLGNGVVPQQGAAALRILLNRMAVAA